MGETEGEGARAEAKAHDLGGRARRKRIAAAQRARWAKVKRELPTRIISRDLSSSDVFL